MTSKPLFDDIAKAFRLGKVPGKATRDEFLRCYSEIENEKERNLDRAFGSIYPKGMKITWAKNKLHMRETCLRMIAAELLRSRDITVEQAIQDTKSKHDKAKQNVGLNQLQKWWNKGYEIESADTATSEEWSLWLNLQLAKNRYRKTEFKEQIVQFTDTGLLKLSSLKLLPVKKKIPR